MKVRIKITGHAADKARSSPSTAGVIFKDPVKTFADIKADGIGRKALAAQLRAIADRVEDQAFED